MLANAGAGTPLDADDYLDIGVAGLAGAAGGAALGGGYGLWQARQDAATNSAVTQALASVPRSLDEFLSDPAILASMEASRRRAMASAPSPGETLADRYLRERQDAIAYNQRFRSPVDPLEAQGSALNGIFAMDEALRRSGRPAVILPQTLPQLPDGTIDYAALETVLRDVMLPNTSMTPRMPNAPTPAQMNENAEREAARLRQAFDTLMNDLNMQSQADAVLPRDPMRPDRWVEPQAVEDFLSQVEKAARTRATQQATPPFVPDRAALPTATRANRAQLEQMGLSLGLQPVDLRRGGAGGSVKRLRDEIIRRSQDPQFRQVAEQWRQAGLLGLAGAVVAGSAFEADEDQEM